MKLLPWKAMLVIALCCIFSDKLIAQQLKLGMQPTILDKDAVLELNSDKQGLLMPRVPKSRITTGGLLFGAKAGMLVYVVDDASIYLKKTAGWVKIADFNTYSAGTGIGIDAAGVISNTGVTSFKTRTGAITPQKGDYDLNLLNDVTITSVADNEVLTFNQATGKWINKAALTSIATSAPITGAGTTASPLALTNGTAANQVLKWNGTGWAADNNSLALLSDATIASPADNQVLTYNQTTGKWVNKAIPTTSIATKSPLSGAGTTASPLALTNGTAANQIFKWDGTNWVVAGNTLALLPDVTITSPANNQVLTYDQATSKWINKAALTSIATSAPITGAGTTASPLALTSGTAANQIFKWDGTNWVVAGNTLALLPDVTVTSPANNQVLTYDQATSKWINKTALTSIVTSTPITGAGTTASPLALTNGTAANQVLKWNGTGWGADNNSLALLSDATITSPANNQVLTYDQTTNKWINKAIPATSIVTKSPLTGAGTTASPLALTNGTAANQILKWDGTNWVAGTETTSTRKLTINAGTGIKQVTPSGAQDLTADRSWTIDADNTNALWNANKLQGQAISTTAPADGQILKWNATKSLYEPADDSTGGVTFAKLTTPDASYADQPFPKVKLKIWEAPGGSPVVNGPAGVTAHAWTIMSLRNTAYTTQLFLDKSTLAIKEWKGNDAQLVSDPGNPWYKVVTTHGDNVFTNGGIIFAKKTSDASSEVAQDAGNFFYDVTNRRLGLANATPQRTLDITGDMRVTGSNGTADNIMGRSSNGDVNNVTVNTTTLSLTAGTLSANSGTALWNANKLSGVNIATTTPTTNQVLTYNGSQWEPKAAAASGLSSVGLSMPSIFSVANSPLTANGTLNVSLANQAANTVLAGPATGTTAGAPTFRALTATDIPSLATQYIQNVSGAIVQTGNFNLTGNGRLAGTLTLSALTQGSALFAGVNGVVSENKTNFFWDNTNNRLGIGNNTPGNAVEINGPAYTGGGLTAATSGLRLKNLATVTPDASNTKVLSINAQGDVIVTKNAANDNWLTSGNVGAAAGSFLGNRDDVPMIIKSNNQSYLEFGRRDLLGLTDTESYGPEYRDPNQKVTHVRSALQFESPSRLYKPMFFVDQNGNFRMKGSAASDDIFEFGATGATVNDGGFDFIIGDDGDEPIIFKSYYYVGQVFTEMMRLQRNKVGIGLTAEPEKILHVNANNDAIRLQNLASTTTAGNLLTIDGNGDVKQVPKNTLLAGSTVTMTPTGTSSTSNAPLSVTAGATNVKLTNTNAVIVNGISLGSTPFDGQTITFYAIATSGSIAFVNNSSSTTTGTKVYTLGNLGAATSGSNLLISYPGSATFTFSSVDNAWFVTAVIP